MTEKLSPGIGLHCLDGDKSPISSPLLRLLLSSAANQEVYKLTQRLLDAIDAKAALRNDKIEMFNSWLRFPRVMKCKEHVESAEKDLQVQSLPSENHSSMFVLYIVTQRYCLHLCSCFFPFLASQFFSSWLWEMQY